MPWYEISLLFVFFGLTCIASYAWRDIRIRRRYIRRLDGFFSSIRQPLHQRRIRTFPTRYRFTPLVMAGAVFVLLLVGEVPLPFAWAAALLTGVVSYLIEAHFIQRQLNEIELQLADFIDLILSLLQSGMALPKALEMATHETGQLLKPYLTDMVGRIRLGDDPSMVIQQLAKQIPLETFQLFSSVLSVQWWSGGSLATTLVNVSAVVRSRIELDQRIRTQSVESQLSVLSILLITYGLSFLMWHVNPASLETFLLSTIGSYLGAGAIMAQAIGIIWISKLSEIKF
ncbi:MAG: pilus assembly protein TadB [Nitrospirales bacterium]|nr:MAG: pilus assembly protein TadB [Nitrospirales bacterium]